MKGLQSTAKASATRTRLNPHKVFGKLLILALAFTRKFVCWMLKFSRNKPMEIDAQGGNLLKRSHVRDVVPFFVALQRAQAYFQLHSHFLLLQSKVFSDFFEPVLKKIHGIVLLISRLLTISILI
jgi:hypothetical protein